MSNRSSLVLAFSFVLLVVSPTESNWALGQPKNEENNEAVYGGKAVGHWTVALKDDDRCVREYAAIVLGETAPAAKALKRID